MLMTTQCKTGGGRGTPMMYVVAMLLLAPACLLFGAGVREADAQPLANQAPGDALIYVGWRGVEDLGPGFEGTRLQGIIEAGDMAQLWRTFPDALVAALDGRQMDGAAAMKVVLPLAQAMWRHPTAVVVRKLDLTNPRDPWLQATVMCDVGEAVGEKDGADGAGGAEALVGRLQVLVEQMPRHLRERISVGQAGGLVTVTTHQMGSDPPAIGGGGRGVLLDQPAFRTAMAAGHDDPVSVVYVDFEGIQAHVTEVLDVMAAHERDAAELRTMWPGIQDMLGLAGVRRLIVTMGFEGRDTSIRAFVHAPAPRTGLMALLSEQPVSNDLLRQAPKSLTYVAAGRFDVGRLVKGVREIAAKFDPRMAREVDQAIAELNQQLGVNVESDLLASIGDEWLVYTDPQTTGTNVLGMVAVSPAKDAAKLAEVLSTIETFVLAAVNEEMQRSHIEIHVRSTTYRDVEIRYLATPVFSPAWSMHDGRLYVGLFPQSVAGALSQAGAADSILDRGDFQAMRGRLTKAGQMGLQFTDIPRSAAEAYPLALAASRSYLGFADLLGAAAPAMVIPPLRELSQELAPAGAAVWATDLGWHAKVISPFPYAELLGPQGSVGLLQSALPALVMLPRMMHGLRGGGLAFAMSNARQIAIAMHAWAADNGGTFPQGVGDLVVGGYLQHTSLYAQHTRAPLPAGYAEWSDANKRAWLNQVSHFEVVAPGVQSDTAGGDMPIAWQKPQTTHGQAGPVVFGDGHVRMMPAGVAENLIKNSRGGR